LHDFLEVFSFPSSSHLSHGKGLTNWMMLQDIHRREVDSVRQLSSAQTTIQSVQRDIVIVVAVLIGTAGVSLVSIFFKKKQLLFR